MNNYLEKIFNNIKEIIWPTNEDKYNFDLEPNFNNNLNNSNYINTTNSSDLVDTQYKNIFSSLNINLEYLKSKYNTLINSDVIIREFTLNARNKQYNAFIIFIDGMVNSELMNNNVLTPLMLRNRANTFVGNQNQVVSEAISNNITVRKIKKFNLKDYILDCLLPQNSVVPVNSFANVFEGINMGNCLLFIDTLDLAFNIDLKGFKQRSISPPNNEMLIRGPQEAFTEVIRTNTSLIRRVVNNENLIVENISVGKISKTQCAVCYINNIANNALIAEVKYRINNLNVDYITTSRTIRTTN